MDNINELRQDLNFVANVLRRGQQQPVRSIFLLWALLVPVGFALVDFAPRYCGLYWLVVGTLGGIASGFLGRADAQRRGVRDDDYRRRVSLHWVTMFASFLLFGLAVASGHMEPQSTAPIWLLLTAVAYTLAGIHLERDRAMLPAGIVMFAGYAVLVWLPLPYVWTVTGLLVSGALLYAALRGAAPTAAA